MILLISCELILFTDFIENIDIQYTIGYVFVSSILLVLLINIINMIYNISRRVKSKNRKKRI